MLTPIQKQHGPWAFQSSLWNIPRIVRTLTVSEQLPKIKSSTDPEWLRAVAADRDTGKTVRLAADRRLRSLARINRCPRS